MSFASSRRIERTLHGILADRYGGVFAVRGWLYAVLIDRRFLDAGLPRHPIRRRPPITVRGDEAGSPDEAAAAHLARLAALRDPAALYRELEALTLLDTPSLTRDSGLTAPALGAFFTGDALNVLIAGAGPIGLALASALKVALRDRVNVLVVEKRTVAPHHKAPYGRRWITAVSHATLEGLVEEPVRGILAGIGDPTYIGAPINVLETLLLLSCRRMGVRFLFDDAADLSFAGGLPVDVCFDASGNRLQPPAKPASPAEVTAGQRIEADRLTADLTRVAGYGVQMVARSFDQYVTVGSYQGTTFPIHERQLLALAMWKIVHVPGRLYAPLLAYVRAHNADNKLYVWPGALREEINQVLVIVNLERAEYDTLCTEHEYPLGLDEALQIRSLDPRTQAILQLIAAGCDERERAAVGLDAPYRYRPYLVEETAPGRLHGKPIVRVGDSIYNGNVKIANGLGPHLHHLHHVQAELWRLASSVVAERVARSMAVLRLSDQD